MLWKRPGSPGATLSVSAMATHAHRTWQIPANQKVPGVKMRANSYSDKYMSYLARLDKELSSSCNG